MVRLFLISMTYSLFSWFLINRVEYWKSQYYRQTRNSLWKVRRDKGKFGEYSVYKALAGLEGDKFFLFNAYLPKYNGETTEVDVILLHNSGIYVFESKNYRGRISGHEDEKNWKQVIPFGHGYFYRQNFYNPIMQNKGHVYWLWKNLKGCKMPIYSYVVFGHHSKLKGITLTSGNHFVVKEQKLLKEVRRNVKARNRRIPERQLREVYNRLYAFTQVSEKCKERHIETLKKKYGN